ncbi:MAG: T9SS type A sorting domain-containing protein, partial [Calditrichaeota bacterium]|nr:T9SS type A sorting domain-containing protein [Calditrichota bacterium]
FDTAVVSQLEIMAECSGNGHTLLFHEMWTGRPIIQWWPPPLPPFVVLETYANLITWIDVPSLSGEVYNLYYSRNPINDIHAEGVEVVDRGLHIPENSQAWRHYLFSPLGDSLVSYYYAVTAVDAAGNESSPATTTTPATNTARGIATLSLVAPVNFMADGDLAEWDGIRAFRLFPSEGAHVVANTTVDDDADLSLQLRLAGDDAYFYFAFEVGDDLVDTTSAQSWRKDSPELFLGLYDYHGPPHNFYDRGAAPDYHFSFLPGKVIIVNLDSAVVLTGSSSDYYWGEDAAAGYVVEGKMSWSDIAAPGGDDIFVPVEGTRIPFDLAVNDADGGGIIQGILTWSPYNEATSGTSPSFWLYSWVGERDFIQGLENPDPPPGSYTLDQNYPNPFNPVTTIRYRLPQTATIMLTIYDILGQEIRTLLHGRQPAGDYSVVWDGRDGAGRSVSSGIYVYRMMADGHAQSRKMLLLR